MDKNIYFNGKKLSLPLPFVIGGIVLFFVGMVSLLFLFFIALPVALLSLLTKPWRKSGGKRFEDDGRTIVLRDDEYEIFIEEPK